MTWLINAVAWIVDFLLSRKARFLALLPIKASVTAIFILVAGLYVSSILLFVYFLVSVFNAVFALIKDLNTIHPADGEVYGITISSVWNAFLGFMNASGLADAIMSASALLVSLLSGYFAFAITKIVAEKLLIFLNSISDMIRMYDS